MTKRKNRPCGWMCVERKTGACDGTFTIKARAEYTCGCWQALWPGSVWDLVPDPHGGGSKGKFHMDEPMYSKLVDAYGPENLKALDKYEENLRDE